MQFCEIVGQELSESRNLNCSQDTTAGWIVSNERQHGGVEKKTSAAEGHQPTAEVEGKVMVGLLARSNLSRPTWMLQEEKVSDHPFSCEGQVKSVQLQLRTWYVACASWIPTAIARIPGTYTNPTSIGIGPVLNWSALYADYALPAL